MRDNGQSYLTALGEKLFSQQRERVSNVCFRRALHFSVSPCGWQKLIAAGQPGAFTFCWRIYDQVVSGFCPSLGNTTPALLMEDILYLITSAGAQPALLLTVQNKVAGKCDLCHNTDMMVQCLVLQICRFTVYI